MRLASPSRQVSPVARELWDVTWPLALRRGAGAGWRGAGRRCLSATVGAVLAVWDSERRWRQRAVLISVHPQGRLFVLINLA